MDLATPKTTLSRLQFVFEIFHWDFSIVIYNFFSNALLFCQTRTLLSFFSTIWELGTKKIGAHNNEPRPPGRHFCCRERPSGGEKLYGGEIKMVMDSLGIPCDSYGDHKFGVDDLSALFDQVEPSLEELKEAFDVFDEKKDGYIDAQELQRVLGTLGLLQEGSQVEDCRRMISAFDKNGDGLVDFNEFVNFMEKCLC